MKHSIFEQPLMIIDNGEGEMVYQNNRFMPINRAYLERLSKAIQNTINAFDLEGLDDEMIEQIELNEKEKYLNEERKRYEREKLEKKQKPKDHLYLIFNNESKCLKIGRSKNPRSRLNQLQIASHEKLSLLFIVAFMGELEKELHLEFKSLRLNSEWFRYDESIIKKFEKLSNK